MSSLDHDPVSSVIVARTPTDRSPLPTSRLNSTKNELSKIRAAVEHAIAQLKTWRMLSEEGSRHRAALEKYLSMIKAVIGLFFFAAYE
jgi:hypothetical protein